MKNKKTKNIELKRCKWKKKNEKQENKNVG